MVVVDIIFDYPYQLRATDSASLAVALAAVSALGHVYTSKQFGI